MPMVLHRYQVDLIEQWTDPFVKAHATCIAAGAAETTTLVVYFIEKDKTPSYAGKIEPGA